MGHLDVPVHVVEFADLIDVGIEVSAAREYALDRSGLPRLSAVRCAYSRNNLTTVEVSVGDIIRPRVIPDGTAA